MHQQSKITIQNVQSEEDFLSTSKDFVLKRIHLALERNETCRIGLAGGSTPQALYSALSKEKLPWNDIHLIQTDERMVPADHAESNQKMILQNLATPAKVKAENLHFFDMSELQSTSPDSIAEKMSEQLIDLTHERFPLFDLLILGVGEDGHIASLFPGDEGEQSTLYATKATAQNYPTPERLSLSLVSLKQATQVLFLLKGDKKKAIFNEIEKKAAESLHLNSDSESEAKPEADHEFKRALDELLDSVPSHVLFFG
jgi:6-phosphogluconolactonase